MYNYYTSIELGGQVNTKKTGPRKRYGDREPFRLLLPIEEKHYIERVSKNTTEWILTAIKERRERDESLQR